jgi:hypothetical protein
MKKGEVRNLIYSLITPLVAEKGFQFKKAGEGILIRNIPGGNQRIGVPLVDYNPQFKFSLIITIRLDAVEEIANKFNVAPPKYHSETTTFTAQLERFMPGKNTQFMVATEEDIKAAIVSLKPVIQERIIPFLDENQSLQTLAKTIDFLDIPKVLSGTGAGMRAMTLAKLTKQPNFENIAATYQQRISQYPKAAQEELQNFIQHLRQSY